jgi:hypothetical protein
MQRELSTFLNLLWDNTILNLKVINMVLLREFFQSVSKKHKLVFPEWESKHFKDCELYFGSKRYFEHKIIVLKKNLYKLHKNLNEYLHKLRTLPQEICTVCFPLYGELCIFELFNV